MPRLTVFTPTYNRADVLGRVYVCLHEQTYRDFKWVIIDDGSTDQTSDLVAAFTEAADFPIEYHYQENRGKHVATNRAVAMCDTELFIIADSDDAFTKDAIEILVREWDAIPDKAAFKGVTCRVFEHDTGAPVGAAFPAERFDSTDEIAYFKLKMRSEKWMLFKTEALRAYPFPEIEDAHFYPETVTWQLMAKQYKTRYIDRCLREYYRDTTNSVTKGNSHRRYRENIHLWAHFINDESRFFWCYPKRFIQSYVGLSRDGFLNGYGAGEILGIANTGWKRFCAMVWMPFGWILYKRARRADAATLDRRN